MQAGANACSEQATSEGSNEQAMTLAERPVLVRLLCSELGANGVCVLYT